MDITQELRDRAVEQDDPLLHRAANEIARLRVALEQCRVNRWSPMLVEMICDRELRK
jgi:hypothetical protein